MSHVCLRVCLGCTARNTVMGWKVCFHSFLKCGEIEHCFEGNAIVKILNRVRIRNQLKCGGILLHFNKINNSDFELKSSVMCLHLQNHRDRWNFSYVSSQSLHLNINAKDAHLLRHTLTFISHKSQQIEKNRELSIEKIRIIPTGRHLCGVGFSLYMQLFDDILKLLKCEPGMTLSTLYKCILLQFLHILWILYIVLCSLNRDSEYKTRRHVLYQELLFYSSREL